MTEYETVSGEVLSGATKVATFLKHAPSAVKDMLRAHMATIGSDCGRLRDILRVLLVNTPPLAEELALYHPMG